MQFNIRSMFALCSINSGATSHADTSRISVLSLTLTGTPVERADRFARLQQSIATMDMAFVDGLHARMIKLIPTIRANANMLALGGARLFSSRRTGDQYGALLAGVYALHSDAQLSYPEAVDWLASNRDGWADERAMSADTDERVLLNLLLTSYLSATVAKGSSSTRYELTVGECVQMAVAQGDAQAPLSEPEAKSVLARNGFRVEEDTLLVANQHPSITKWLLHTAWSVNWGRTLVRLPGASGGRVYRFSGAPCRTTAIPLDVVLGEEGPSDDDPPEGD